MRGECFFKQILKDWKSDGVWKQGVEGKVYKYNKKKVPFIYKNCVLKETQNNVLGNSDENNKKTSELLKKLEGLDLGENLMKVKNVYGGNHAVLERIDGRSYGEKDREKQGRPDYFSGMVKWRQSGGSPDINEYLRSIKHSWGLNLDLDFFIDKWCIGLFKAEQILHEKTGAYVCDIRSDDIIIRNKIPVLTDYSFLVDENQPMDMRGLVGVLLDAIENEVKESDKKSNKYLSLQKYLESIKDYEYKKSNIEKILSNLGEIKNMK